MKRKITSKTVAGVKPGKDLVFLWDTEVKGLGLRVTPNGVKSYVLQYQPRGQAGERTGQSRRMTIGRHGSPWTPETARREAKRLLGQVEDGGDPAAERSGARKGLTVAQLAQRFIEQHIRPKTKPSTAKRYEALLSKVVIPNWNRRRVADITRADVTELHYSRRHVPRDANQMLAVLSKMFNLAEIWGLRLDGSNPCRGVERYPEPKRERFLSEQELARLGEALAEGERDGKVTISEQGKKPRRILTVNPTALAAIRLLLLTGARRSEILGLQWDWVDFERGIIRLPDSKTGAKNIHLNAPSRAVLAGLPRLEGNPYVFPGQREGKPFYDIDGTWGAVRSRAELEGVRLHDLRHTHASVGVAGGLSLPIVGALLGHTQPVTTQRYAHLSTDPLQAASEIIGERIFTAMSAQSTNDNVRTISLGKGKPVSKHSP